MIPARRVSRGTIVSAMSSAPKRARRPKSRLDLVMPTMAGAFAYDLMKKLWGQMGGSNWLDRRGRVRDLVRRCLHRGETIPRLCVERRLRRCFAWWRIIIGALGLVGLGLFK